MRLRMENIEETKTGRSGGGRGGGRGSGRGPVGGSERVISPDRNAVGPKMDCGKGEKSQIRRHSSGWAPRRPETLCAAAGPCAPNVSDSCTEWEKGPAVAFSSFFLPSKDAFAALYFL